VKVAVAIVVAAGALALGVTSSMAGAAPAASHPIRFLRHAALATHASRLSATARTTKSAGFTCISACSKYESTINQFFSDVAAASLAGAADNVYSVATQYPNILNSTTFGGSFVDGTPYPTTTTCHDGFDKYCVTDTQLQAEIGKVVAGHHWPRRSQAAMYFIFTPAHVGICIKKGRAAGNACTTNYFCAYHSYSSTGSFIYAVEPDAAAVADNACDSGAAPAGNHADDTLSSISHEQMEAITDPLGDLSGWTSDDPETYEGIPNFFKGSEIGDLCAYNYGTPLGATPGGQPYNQVINGHDYFLQQEYSNADAGCVQYLGGTPTNFPPTDSRYEGVGPLVYHDGPVMTTNQVYAIYWVPARPANKTLPTISGSAKTGKMLKASHGTWSNLPKFAYRWLRCSPAGRSCKGIAKGSSYVLTADDAHHKIEVQVTATNAIGHASATSPRTRTVTR
jgi:hypothetical protein